MITPMLSYQLVDVSEWPLSAKSGLSMPSQYGVHELLVACR